MVDRDEIRGMRDAIEATPPAQAALFEEPAAAPELPAERKAGRPPGAQNRSTVATREEVERLAVEHGMTPLSYLWGVMANEKNPPAARASAAVALLPYTAKKMPVDVNVERRTFSVSLQLGGQVEGEADDGSFVIEGGSEE